MLATFLDNSRESFNELLYPTVLVVPLFQGGVLFGIIAQYLASAFRHKTLLWSGHVDAPSEPTNVSLERAFQIKTTDPLTPYSYEVPKPIL